MTRSWELGNGDLGLCSTCAIFLKVMMHSRSSPANTLKLFHCTDTRMSDIMCDCKRRATTAVQMMHGISSKFLNELLAYKPVEDSATDLRMTQMLRPDSSKKLGMRHDRSSASTSILSGKRASIARIISYKLPSFCSHTFEARSRARGCLAAHFPRTRRSTIRHYIGLCNWAISNSLLEPF